MHYARGSDQGTGRPRCRPPVHPQFECLTARPPGELCHGCRSERRHPAGCGTARDSTAPEVASSPFRKPQVTPMSARSPTLVVRPREIFLPTYRGSGARSGARAARRSLQFAFARVPKQRIEAVLRVHSGAESPYSPGRRAVPPNRGSRARRRGFPSGEKIRPDRESSPLLTIQRAREVWNWPREAAHEKRTKTHA